MRLQTLYGWLTHRYMLYAIVLAMSYGIYYGIAAMSIASAVLATIGFFSFFDTPSRQYLLKNQEALMIGVVLLVFVLSGLISEDKANWLYRTYLSLPYLFIPIGISAFAPIKRETLVNALLIFVLVSTASCLFTIGDYLLHIEEYNALYNVGKTIPTPVLHIRYSFFIALASACCLGMLLDKLVVRPWVVKVIYACLAITIITIHILAVRTGLFALYCGLATVIAVAVARGNSVKYGLGFLLAIIVAGGLAIKFVPSIGNKVNYMMYDLRTLKDGASAQYSDNLRVTSIRLGIDLFLENPIFGVGIGDLKTEIGEKYITDAPEVPEEHRCTPISQYFYWLAAFGLLGTMMIIAALFYPLTLHWRQSYLLICLCAITAFSLVAAENLRLPIGKAIFLLLLCLIYEYLRNHKTQPGKIRVDS